MKRWIINAGIAAYIASLVFGFLCVANRVQFFFPPIYFLTFNMFSGWSGYEGRMRIIGEGESGRYYELSPGPWGEFDPYAQVARQHYDQEFEYGKFLVRPALRHTRHEPMLRMFVVEEEYPKKFNLPDAQYEAYYGKPKPHRSYCHTRFVMNADGDIMNQQPTWLRYQDSAAIADNPRLIADAARNRPFIWSATQAPGAGSYAAAPFLEPTALRVGSPNAE